MSLIGRWRLARTVGIAVMIVGALAASGVGYVVMGGQAHAGSAATHYSVRVGKLTATGLSNPHGPAQRLPKGVAVTAATRYLITQDHDYRQGGHTASATTAGLSIPQADGVTVESVKGNPVSGSPGKLAANFDALYGSLNGTYNGLIGDVEPPDQGLCVGQKAEVELINDLAGFYDRRGKALLPTPIDLNQFFNEPDFFLLGNGVFGQDDLVLTFPTDPRCYYDAPTHAWFASMLVLGLEYTPVNGNYQFVGFYGRTHLDLAYNTSADPTTPWTTFQIDSTDDGTNGTPNDAGCPCLGDQPLLGVDHRAVYLSTNEFPIFANGFNGAQIYAIDKNALISGASTVNFAQFGNLSIGGSVAASIQPMSTPDKTAGEFFLNSLDPNATVDDRVGVWAMTNEGALSQGHAPTLSSWLIHSETYGQPPLASQPGSSDPTLNTDDDRMQQVSYHEGMLYSSLDTAINIRGDTTTRSGAAWFVVRPRLDRSGNLIGASMVRQGYVAVKGNYLLYPAVGVSNDGASAMVMTLSGPDYYPSAVYSVRDESGYHVVRVAALGTQAENGFTCQQAYGGPPCRWGDYSATAIDPNRADGTLGIWMATEYVDNDPADPYLNYSTRILEA
jgi:hypothetical protein